MRYYPAFDVKSGPDALFTRFLSVSCHAPEAELARFGRSLFLITHL